MSAPPDRSYAPVSIALIDSAIARLAAGELDGAATRLGSLFALPPDFRIDPDVRRLADLDRALRRLPPGGQAGRLADELDEFRSAAS